MMMEKQYLRQPNDTVTVHPQVLRTIVGAATLSIEGVVRLGQASGTLDRWLRLDPSEDGVKLWVENDEISVDIALVLDASLNLYETGLRVQQEVSRTLQEYVGMNVCMVNVHVEDVVFGAK
ncbi:MAG TPA: Asp23/Gls24 family envelope stress response protein [Aggregatilineales bacterium]|nr:Asp23/Gls24 family envelope stress response protein [Aggregatilineales bacterium]